MKMVEAIKKKVQTVHNVGLRKAVSHKVGQLRSCIISQYPPLDDMLFLWKEKRHGYPHEIEMASRLLGYVPNINAPRSFNEKLIWQKLHDRNPIFPVIADKVRVRNYVREKLGDKKADDILIPLLHVTRNPASIPFDKLSGQGYVIKANHGSGTNLIFKPDESPDRELVAQVCEKWLKQSYGLRFHEWHYQKIPRHILIEPLLLDNYGNLPKDYKLFFFHGSFRLLQIDFDRQENHTRSLFDENLRRLPVEYNYPKSNQDVELDPISEMIALGSVLSKGLNFVRVDFYWHRGRVFFGELTVFPEAGYGPFMPREFDFKLGAYLNIDTLRGAAKR